MLYWLLHILLSNFSTFLNSLQLSQISIHLSVICFKSPSMSIYLINNLSLTSSDLIIPVFTDIDLRSTHHPSSILNMSYLLGAANSELLSQNSAPSCNSNCLDIQRTNHCNSTVK